MDSIDLLNNSGIQFPRHKEEGIDMTYFAELLTTSGIVLNEDVKFISFHRFVVATIYIYEHSSRYIRVSLMELKSFSLIKILILL